MDNQSLNNSADVSNQTSNSSTASEVLIRSTRIPAPSSSANQLPTTRRFDTSGSSQSSTGSQRVRIKAKYLREVPSPFDKEEDVVPEGDLNIPPALIRAASPTEPAPVDCGQRVPLIDQPVSHSMSSGRNVYANKDNHPTHSSLKFRSDSVLVQGHQNHHQLFAWEPQSDTTAVKVTQYQAGQRKKVMQESLGKKQDNKAPVKRYVQPNFVNREPAASESNGVANVASEATTVAAMTAAAVAATAPFLRSQSDLEAKINGILEKLSSLDNDRGEAPARKPSKTEDEVERRLHELADVRLQQMERIQQQQLEWQTRMMSHMSVGGGINHEDDYRGSMPSHHHLPSQPHHERTMPHPAIKEPPAAHLNPAVSRDYFAPDNQPPVVKYQLATPIPDATKKSMIRNTHSTQTSPLDTPAPRRRPPLPISKDRQPRTGRGLLEEILRKDAEANGSMQSMNESMEGTHQIDHSENKQRSQRQPSIIQASAAENQAADMINELRELKTEMKSAIQDTHKIELIGQQRSHVNPRRSPGDSVREEACRQYDRWQRALDEPAPLEKYLKRRDEHQGTHGPVAPSPLRYNAPVIPPSCAQAQALLETVRGRRANLEANLEMVLRGREEEEAYTFIENLYKDGSMRERAHIKRSVDQRIEALNNEIQRELSLERPKGSESAMKDVQPTLSKRPPRSLAKPPLEKRGTTGAAQPNKKKARSKIDTGLKKAGKKDVAETRRKNKTSAREKENRPVEKKPTTSPPQIPFYKDEDYLTRVYGKAHHSPKRRTIKAGPYLRYNSSPPRSKVTRPSAVQLIQGSKVKSTKTQTKQERAPQLHPVDRQFYFDPNTHTALPQQSGSRHGIDAPTQGNLIPMAIPLMKPRTGGTEVPLSIRRRRDDDDSEDEPVEGAVHDANILYSEIESERKPKVQLKIQSMPNIDIHPTSPSPTEIRIEEHREEEVEENEREDARVPGFAESSQFQDYVAVADQQIEDEPIDELPVPGIAFAGQSHHAVPYHGPPFPPEPPPPLTEDLPSSTIASDIRRKELLEDHAVQWIEQELMARMVSDMYQRREEARVKEDDGGSQDDGEVDSEDSVSDVSSHAEIVDRVGGAAGLQLFVDAGQPVDQGLVLDLIREVIAERIAATLSQQEKERSPAREVIQVEEDTSDIEQEPLKSLLATPEVTPVNSPEGSPPVRRSLPSTPVETPTPSENESLQELMVSMSRPVSAVEDDLGATIAGPPSPVKTPEQTPPPSPPATPVTPEASLLSLASPTESPLKSTFKRSPSPEPWTDDPPLAEEALLEQMGGTSPAKDAEVTEHPEESLVHVTPLPPTPLKLPDTPVYQSPESSDNSESTHDLTSTETTDRPISEGEWLNGCSEGEIVGRFVRGGGTYTSSSEDTMLQTEAMEDLTMDEPPSEGEVLAKKVHFSRDPALALLAKIHQQPPGQVSQAHHSMMDGDLSLGEVGIRQRILPSAATRGLPPAGHHQLSDSEVEAGEVKDINRKSSRNGRTSPGEVIPIRREPEVDDFTLRMSHLRSAKSKVSSAEMKKPGVAPPLKELEDSPQEESEDAPQGESEEELAYKEVPSKIPIARPRVIQVISKARSPEAPVSDQLEKGPAKDEVNKEEPWPTANFGGTQTLSDFGTRTLTPDALNMDAYLRSGYLAQSFSQSEPATTDFEQTGTLIGQNTLNNNNGGETLNMSMDSLEMSRDKSQTEKGTRKFMVTLPTAHELEVSLSQSDIDIEKDDEISDVSEIM